MKKFTTSFPGALTIALFFLIAFISSPVTNAQNFSQKGLNFNGIGSLNNGTSLSFGPDGRLYVTEYMGSVKIFTVEREGPGSYTVTSMEELKGIQEIQDHNDDGTLYNGIYRETIGLAVTGTEANPVIYVSSSDFRIGGGGGGGSGDVGLDTNSGIITRYSWNGSSWDEVDIVRGLPRSEENHATNGMDLATINGIEYLIVAQGGHTNAGGPSTNFAYTTEYALSAAILSINLTVLNSMPVLEDNGRKYIYDLPTLDDPTRPNKNGITDPDAPGYDGVDVNDPFGGNDGLNQAMIVPGGPVQIFSPGYRNAYDLVVTKSGAVYVTDNGSNGGWGGFPVNEGTSGLANNNYDPKEPGSSSSSGGEQVNNKDHLTLVTANIHEYVFGSFYGGHPTPVRANPQQAGLYTNPAKTGTEGAIFRTLKYHPTKSTAGFTNDPGIGLPANWPPVPYANPVEGDWRGPDMENPDGPNDEIVTVWGTNTNGIAEYTASNFEGSMKGNLIAGVNTGELRRVELNPDGGLAKLTPSFASGIGGDALGVTCNGDNDIFPGTIWVATLSGKLVVLEPQDYVICIGEDDPGYDPLADNDFDGYTNQDEIDNGSDPCNGGAQPNDFDKSAGGVLVSDMNDLDDDNDGILDANDPFQLGDPNKEGTDAFDLPVLNELFSSNPTLKGYMGLGMTGLMNNGDPNPNWLNWLDRRDDPNDPNPNDILGGAIGAMTMQMTSGTALGTTNTQEKGFQYGVRVGEATGEFIVSGGLVNFHAPLQLYGDFAPEHGELGIFIGDGTQSNYIKFVLTRSGIMAQQEINDVPQEPISLELAFENRPESGVSLNFEVDPFSGEIVLTYRFDNGSFTALGTIKAQGAVLDAIKNYEKDLAVGFIGSSNKAGVEVEGTWDYLNVTGSGPYIVRQFENLERKVNALPEDFDLNNYFDDDNGPENIVYTVEANTNPLIGATTTGNTLSLSYPSIPAKSTLTLRATDEGGRFAEQTFGVNISEVPVSVVLYRVNSGGPAIAAIDGGIAWGADTAEENSPYLSEPARNKTYFGEIKQYTDEVDRATTPLNIYGSERSDDRKGAPDFTYSFPVSEPGNYEVRIYVGNSWIGTSSPGDRIYDVSLEGTVYPGLDDLDPSSLYGHSVGGVLTQMVEVTDGLLEVSFLHGSIENPFVNGIEIIGPPGEVVPVEIPIEVAQIPDQVSLAGTELDGSLAVSAGGGEGNLSYSMTGAPEGIVIEPTNGQIGGFVAADAADLSPYTVHIKVDDSDNHTNDAVTISFTWSVTKGEPVITEALPDLERTVGAEDEVIMLNGYFTDDDGVENLVYTVENNTGPLIGAVISGSTLTLAFPDTPSESHITVRATDEGGRFIEQTFKVNIIEVPVSVVLYRVNSGGPAIAAIDGGIAWGADTAEENSPYLSEPARNKTYFGEIKQYTDEVDRATTPLTIYGSERSDDRKGAPDFTYSFPVSEPGTYEVRIYVGNSWIGTSSPGDRSYDISLEGTVYPELNDLDPSLLYGHSVGGVLTKMVEVTDGVLEISFLHGSIENPLVNGIEIIGPPGGVVPVETPIEVAQIPDQVSLAGTELDGSLVVSAGGGEGNLSYSMTGAPEGIVIEPTNGRIGGFIAADAADHSPYTVHIKVDDSDDHTNDAVTTSFTWSVTKGDPVITEALPDLERTVGAEDEVIMLNGYFTDDDGVENLIYTIVNNTDPLVKAGISGNTLVLAFPDTPVESHITVRATDEGGRFIEQTFKVNIIEVPVSVVLYRVNSGGPAIAAIDGGIAWGADTAEENSPYLSEPARNKTYFGEIKQYTDEVDRATTPLSIYGSERSDDRKGAPDFTYSFPVSEPGNYEVRIYVGNSWIGTSSPGDRSYDISLEGTVYPELNDLDPSLLYGHSVGGVLTRMVEVTDGVLEVSFLHGSIENPLVNGIEIIGPPGEAAPVETPIEVAQIPDQVSFAGTALDGSLVVSASGGDGPLSYSILGAPAGVVIGSSSGVITGTIANEAVDLSPYNVTVSVNDDDTNTDDTVHIHFSWTVHPGGPVIVENIPDIERVVDSPNEDIVLSNYFDDNEGVENLVFSVSGNTGNAVGTNISGNILTISYSSEPVVADISIRATDAGANYVEQTFTVTVIEDPAGSPIEVTQIDDQTHAAGDILDGSLQVLASGGAGTLSFSISGAPTGITIDSASGIIGGSIGPDADNSSPYSVVVTVDDSDDDKEDAASMTFNWKITAGAPVIVQNLPNLERYPGAANEEIDLTAYFNDNQGAGNLIFSVVTNTNETVIATVHENKLVLDFPDEPAISDITVRATDAGFNFVEQTFTVTVIEDPAGSPILVSQIDDQNHAAGDILHGSLQVLASGGEGTYSFSISGAPAGITIGEANGIIGGKVGADADAGSPYTVVVSVDDSDEDIEDSVNMIFKWIITEGTPVIVQNLQDLARFSGAANEEIDLTAYFDDNQGADNLIFSLVTNTNELIVATIFDNNLVLDFPEEPGISDLTIRATDAGFNFVEQTFKVTVMDETTSGSPILYRVNAGGPAIASIDGELSWGGDTSTQPSPYLVEPGTNTIGNYTMTSYSSTVDLSTTPTGIFNSERSDASSGLPNMTYSFPVSQPGTFEVRLYFGSGHPGNARAGRQIFDVEIEGVIYQELDNLDLAGTYGHQVGGVITKTVQIFDNNIDIVFLHGARKNPMVNGIEIIKKIDSGNFMITGGNLSARTVEDLALTIPVPKVSLYPNPAVSEVYLEVKGISTEITLIQLYGYDGRLVKTYQADQVHKAEGLYRLDVSGLPEGTYVLRCDSDAATPVRLVIKK